MEKVAPIPEQADEPSPVNVVIPDNVDLPSPTGEMPLKAETPVSETVASAQPPENIEETLVRVETDLFDALVSSTNGGSIVSFKLRGYELHDSSSVNLINKDNENNLLLRGRTIDGDFFELGGPWMPLSNRTKVSVGNQPVSLSYETSLGGFPVKKTLTFHPGSYLIDVVVDIDGSSSVLSQGQYRLEWNGGLPITEKNEKDDLFYFKGYAYQGGDLQDPKLDKDEAEAVEYRGQTDWVAVRNKYFVAALIPSSPAQGASVGGFYEDKTPLYSVSLNQAAVPGQKVSLYLGPLEYKRIKALGVDLDRVMTLGWSFIRPISRGVLLLLTALHNYIPNYGVILVLFSILVKIVVYPLTKKSYQSTRKMQVIQPQITALREKYKSDPQKLNKATMELYKESGVNPMGGCLPLLLQMPLLFALFQVFRSTIEFRGAPFILWITDLSAPDTLLEIGGFPLNILPLLMTATMLLQQTMMPAQAGQQKTMMYAMNIMFLFIFYRFPSGLNLYYTLFNVLTILQQKYLTPHDSAPASGRLESKTKIPKKKK